MLRLIMISGEWFASRDRISYQFGEYYKNRGLFQRTPDDRKRERRKIKVKRFFTAVKGSSRKIASFEIPRCWDRKILVRRKTEPRIGFHPS